MKIIIDTKEDSKEHIKKAAQFLHTIADSHSLTEFNPEPQEGAFGMFDSSPESSSPELEVRSPESEEPEEKEPFNMNNLVEY